MTCRFYNNENYTILVTLKCFIKWIRFFVEKTSFRTFCLPSLKRFPTVLCRLRGFETLHPDYQPSCLKRLIWDTRGRFVSGSITFIIHGFGAFSLSRRSFAQYGLAFTWYDNFNLFLSSMESWYSWVSATPKGTVGRN